MSYPRLEPSHWAELTLLAVSGRQFQSSFCSIYEMPRTTDSPSREAVLKLAIL